MGGRGEGEYVAQAPVPVPRSRMFCDVVVSGGHSVESN